jgi:hypothetical protein
MCFFQFNTDREESKTPPRTDREESKASTNAPAKSIPTKAPPKPHSNAAQIPITTTAARISGLTNAAQAQSGEWGVELASVDVVCRVISLLCVRSNRSATFAAFQQLCSWLYVSEMGGRTRAKSRRA